MRTPIGAMQNSINTATDIAALLRRSNVSFQPTDLGTQLVDLEKALTEARNELAEIQEVLAEKDRYIAQLKVDYEAKSRVVVHLLND